MTECLSDNGSAMDLLAAVVSVEGEGKERVRRLLDEALERLPEIDQLTLSCDAVDSRALRLDFVYGDTKSRNPGAREEFRLPYDRRFRRAIAPAGSSYVRLLAGLEEPEFSSLVGYLIKEGGLDYGHCSRVFFEPLGLEDMRCFSRITRSGRLIRLVAPVREGQGDLSESAQALLLHAARLIEATALGVAWPDSLRRPSIELSKSQRVVYELALRGLTDKQIALRLHRSHHTVRSHLKAVYARYHVSSRAELLALHLDQRDDDAVATAFPNGSLAPERPAA